MTMTNKVDLPTGPEYTAFWATPIFHIEDRRKVVLVEFRAGEMPDGTPGTWTVFHMDDGSVVHTGSYRQGGTPGTKVPSRKTYEETGGWW